MKKKSVFIVFGLLVAIILALVVTLVYQNKLIDKLKKNETDKTNYSVQVDDKAERLTVDERRTLSEKVRKIEDTYDIDLAIVILDEDLTGVVQLYESEYDGDISHQVKVFAEKYAEINKMGVGDNNQDNIVFLDNWNIEADGQLYSWITVSGKCIDMISDEECSKAMEALSEITDLNADPYEQYLEVLESLENYLSE